MPRGYLKHKKSVGVKKALGGSSRKSGRCKSLRDDAADLAKSKLLVNRWLDAEIQEGFFTESEHECDSDHGSGFDDREVGTLKDVVAKCAICLEIKPLMKLFRKCNHSLACQDCLKHLYVQHSLNDVTLYPLRCFHPSCDLILRATQLERCLDISLHSPEMVKFLRMIELAKGYHDQDAIRVIHCPGCDFPRRVRCEAAFEPPDFEVRAFKCRSCSKEYGWRVGRPEQILDDIAVKIEKRILKQELREGHHLSPTVREREMLKFKHQSTIDALALLTGDKVGHNDGWTICPRQGCNLVISKGYGCNHMRCVCGHTFDWVEAGGHMG